MPFFFSGSTPSDFSQPTNVTNPLPDCPSYPNCTRTTISSGGSVEEILEKSREILTTMDAQRIRTLVNDDRISAVFKVLFFRDDFDVQVTSKNDEELWIHLRSASRIGFGDLGVNRRRIQKFIKHFKTGN